MTSISVKMKDGTFREFPHKGQRPGGSWTNHVRYEGGFAIITDEWETEVAIPAVDIKEVVVTQGRIW